LQCEKPPLTEAPNPRSHNTRSIARFSDLSAFAYATAEAVVTGLANVLAGQPKAVLAVPGGRTSQAVIPVLATLPLPWERVSITLTDERCVPPSHPDSNERLLRSLLKGPAAAATVLGLYTGAFTPEAALPELLARRPWPDIVLLGMGEDGHIASLFPGDPANRATERLAAVSRPDHARITLTPAALVIAPVLILAFAGKAKQAVFNRALIEGPAEDLPVRHALHAGARVLIGP
jgi:6-phosphogluconolactonase